MNVTMNKKPDEAVKPIIKSLNGHVVTDSLGRKITLRELDFLAESDLMHMLGSKVTLDVVYLNGYIMPAVSVAEIDGEALDLPASMAEVRVAMNKLGREGNSAVLVAQREFAEQQAAREAEERAAVKNS